MDERAGNNGLGGEFDLLLYTGSANCCITHSGSVPVRLLCLVVEQRASCLVLPGGGWVASLPVLVGSISGVCDPVFCGVLFGHPPLILQRDRLGTVIGSTAMHQPVQQPAV